MALMELPRGVWSWLDQSASSLHQIAVQLKRIADCMDAVGAAEYRLQKAEEIWATFEPSMSRAELVEHLMRPPVSMTRAEAEDWAARCKTEVAHEGDSRS
jgi:hypothetical protein